MAGKVDLAQMAGCVAMLMAITGFMFMLGTDVWNLRMYAAGSTLALFPSAYAYARGHENGYRARQAEVREILRRGGA